MNTITYLQMYVYFRNVTVNLLNYYLNERLLNYQYYDKL